MVAYTAAAPYPPVLVAPAVVHPIVPVVKYSAPVVTSHSSSSIVQHHAAAPVAYHAPVAYQAPVAYHAPAVVKTYAAPVHTSYSSQSVYKAPKANLVVAPLHPVVPVVQPAIYYH